MYLLIKMIPEDIWLESQKQSENMWINGKPKNWYKNVINSNGDKFDF